MSSTDGAPAEPAPSAAPEPAPKPEDASRWPGPDLPLFVLLPAIVVVALATLYVAGQARTAGVVIAAAVVAGGVALVIAWSPRPQPPSD